MNNIFFLLILLCTIPPTSRLGAERGWTRSFMGPLLVLFLQVTHTQSEVLQLPFVKTALCISSGGEEDGSTELAKDH